MRCSDLRQIINEKANECKKAIAFTERNEDNSPEVLVVRSLKGKNKYFSRNNNPHVTEVYLGVRKKEEIKRLEIKNYYTKLKKVAQANVELYEKAKKVLDRARDLDEVFCDIPDAKKHLIQPYHEEVDESYTEKWNRTFIQRQTVAREGGYTLSNGIRVRSKSEYIIGERLIAAGIPFYYEMEIVIDHVDRWWPDFYVLNKRTKQTYFWEHFGMMDSPEYSSNVCGKITTYARNDIVLGKNLIISMESQKNPLDIEYIDEMIKQYLL